MQTSKSSFIVSDKLIDEYRKHGVVLLSGVFNRRQLDPLAGAMERTLARHANYFHYRLIWPEDQAFTDYCKHSSAPTLAAQLLQTDRVSLLYDQLFVKAPRSGAATGWHNDQPYWPVKGPDLITLWIALDDIDTANGSMEFIIGSHLWQRRFTPFYADETGGFDRYRTETDSDLEPLPDFDAERDNYNIVSFDMRAGDVLAFNGMIVHSARGNSSDRRRRAYAIRYTGRNACYWCSRSSAEFLHDDTLKNGDPFDSDRFPVVYSES